MLDVKVFNDHFLMGKGDVGYPGLRLSVFIYLVDGLLIDTGPYNLSDQIKPFLLAFLPETVVITHAHEDHCGMAFWINEINGKIPIYVHPDKIEEVSKDGNLPLYRFIFWGRRRPFKAEPYPLTVETKKHVFHIIHMGGHTPDHIVLHEAKEGWLFTGDLFLTTRPRVLFFEEKGDETLKAIDKMLSLDFSTLFCSHSGLHKKGRKLLMEKKEYLENLRYNISKLKKEGYSYREIDSMLFRRKPFITYISKGEWSSLNLITSL